MKRLTTFTLLSIFALALSLSYSVYVYASNEEQSDAVVSNDNEQTDAIASNDNEQEEVFDFVAHQDDLTPTVESNTDVPSTEENNSEKHDVPIVPELNSTDMPVEENSNNGANSEVKAIKSLTEDTCSDVNTNQVNVENAKPDDTIQELESDRGLADNELDADEELQLEGENNTDLIVVASDQPENKPTDEEAYYPNDSESPVVESVSESAPEVIQEPIADETTNIVDFVDSDKSQVPVETEKQIEIVPATSSDAVPDTAETENDDPQSQPEQELPADYTGWCEQEGKWYWYSNGVKLGTEGAGEEVQDPETGDWYWLDASEGGARATDTEIVIPYTINGKDSTPKTVRYDSDGKMIKGWYETEEGNYYYDLGTGSKAKGKQTIDKLPCWFDEDTGVGLTNVWEEVNGTPLYWYVDGKRQGYKPDDASYPGMELFDTTSNSWCWLDASKQGKRAISTEIKIPYTYNGHDNTPKWVRYDADGKMVYGWYTENSNTFYYDLITGARKQGRVTIDMLPCWFDDNNGVGKNNAWEKINGVDTYWYVDGKRQGYEPGNNSYTGTEIYDPNSKSWFWLIGTEQGRKAVNTEVKIPYTYNGKDNNPKWVRYGADGKMVKGWFTANKNSYYYDLTTGARQHGKVTIDKLPCWFDDNTGVGKNQVWEKVNGVDTYWYDGGKRQGYEPNNKSYKGKEIFDPASNGWYWLVGSEQGKKATNKEVLIPYTYNGKDNTPKWVRYDAGGRMIKGWYTVNYSDIFYYPDQAGNKYYYDKTTGAMLHGNATVDGKAYSFDSVTGVIYAKAPDVQLSANAPSSVINVLNYGATKDDSKDDTIAIRNAIAAAGNGKTVYIPAGNYIIDATINLTLKSNMNLLMDRNAILNVKSNDRGSYDVLNLRRISNVNIFGGQIKGERYTHTGKNGEWGMGVGIYDSKNINVRYMSILSNWGDGIYLGSENYSYPDHGCNNVQIRGCTISDNRRSNVSVVDAENVTFDSCLITNAQGTAPQCGINIEPNGENGKIPQDRICNNIKISFTTINTLKQGDPMGQYFCFMTIHNPYDGSYISANNIVIDNCEFNGDCGNYSGLNCKISNTKIKGTFYDRKRTTLTNVKYGSIWRAYF